MGKEGQPVLPNDRAAWLAVPERNQRRGVPARAECVVDHEPLRRGPVRRRGRSRGRACARLGAFGPEPIVAQSVRPDDAGLLGVRGRQAVPVATAGDPRGGPQGSSNAPSWCGPRTRRDGSPGTLRRPRSAHDRDRRPAGPPMPPCARRRPAPHPARARAPPRPRGSRPSPGRRRRPPGGACRAGRKDPERPSSYSSRACLAGDPRRRPRRRVVPGPFRSIIPARRTMHASRGSRPPSCRTGRIAPARSSAPARQEVHHGPGHCRQRSGRERQGPMALTPMASRR